MIQLIGLVVAVYCLARLVTIPIALPIRAGTDTDTLWLRVAVVAGVCGLAFVAVLFLAVGILMSPGINPPSFPR
jgi:hypothetical protein